MNQNSPPDKSRRKRWTPPDSNFPEVQPFARTLADASTKGILFFLAVELELRLKQHFNHYQLPPTAVDLEIMLAEATRALLDE